MNAGSIPAAGPPARTTDLPRGSGCRRPPGADPAAGSPHPDLYGGSPRQALPQAALPDASAFAELLAAAARRREAPEGETLPLPEQRDDGGEPPLPGVQANAFASGPAAPAPAHAGPPMVDPAALADMLARFWLRDRERRPGETRVSLGEAAWPATAASLLRLPDGSVSIALEVDARHRQADLSALRSGLAARGVPVASLQIVAG